MRSGSNVDMHAIMAVARKLVAIPSVSGQEKAVVEQCVATFRDLGFDEVTVDEHGSCVARLRIGNGTGPHVLLSGHVDTVVAHEADWSPDTPPFRPVERNGRLYGRGASDMKASLAVMAVVASSFVDRPSCAGTLTVVAGPLEEYVEAVCLLPVLEDAKPDCVIVGEPSSCSLVVGQRGRAEVILEARGTAVHASIGKSVPNAIEVAARAIDCLNEWSGEPAHPVLGGRSLVATNIEIPVGGGAGLDGRGGNSTVPSLVHVTFDARILPGDTPESIKKSLLEHLARAGADVGVSAGFRRICCTTWTGTPIDTDVFIPAWVTDEHDFFVCRAREGLRKAGMDDTLRAYPFCTDGSAVVGYREEHPDRACSLLGFGPSHAGLLHIADEYVELVELEKAARGLQAMLDEILRLSP